MDWLVFADFDGLCLVGGLFVFSAWVLLCRVEALDCWWFVDILWVLCVLICVLGCWFLGFAG